MGVYPSSIQSFSSYIPGEQRVLCAEVYPFSHIKEKEISMLLIPASFSRSEPRLFSRPAARSVCTLTMLAGCMSGVPRVV